MKIIGQDERGANISEVTETFRLDIGFGMYFKIAFWILWIALLYALIHQLRKRNQWYEKTAKEAGYLPSDEQQKVEKSEEDLKTI